MDRTFEETPPSNGAFWPKYTVNCGANDETDQDILKRAEWLNKHLNINLSY